MTLVVPRTRRLPSCKAGCKVSTRMSSSGAAHGPEAEERARLLHHRTSALQPDPGARHLRPEGPGEPAQAGLSDAQKGVLATFNLVSARRGRLPPRRCRSSRPRATRSSTSSAPPASSSTRRPCRSRRPRRCLRELLGGIPRGLRTVHEVVDLSYTERVGVRYLDAVFPRTGEALSGYLNESLLGLLGKIEGHQLRARVFRDRRQGGLHHGRVTRDRSGRSRRVSAGSPAHEPGRCRALPNPDRHSRHPRHRRLLRSPGALRPRPRPRAFEPTFMTRLPSRLRYP